MGFSILPHPLTNFEIQNYYQNKPRFNSVFSRNNLPKKIKDGGNRDKIFYFDIFGVEHVPEGIKKITGNKNIKGKHFLSTSKRFNNVRVL